jgi:hypothetical protein
MNGSARPSPINQHQSFDAATSPNICEVLDYVAHHKPPAKRKLNQYREVVTHSWVFKIPGGSSTSPPPPKRPCCPNLSKSAGPIQQSAQIVGTEEGRITKPDGDTTQKQSLLEARGRVLAFGILDSSLQSSGTFSICK